MLDSKQPDAVGLPTSDVGRGEGSAVEFLVRLGDCFLGGTHQGGQVVPIREIGGLNGWEDPDLGMTGIEEFGPGSRYAVGSFNDDGENGKSGIDRDAERPLLERKQLVGPTPCSLREHDQGMTAFGRKVDSIDDRLPAGSPSLAVDLDDADPPHGGCHKGDLEQFLLCKESPVDRQDVEEQRDIECGQMIGDHDIASIRIDVFDAFDVETYGRYAEEGSCPSLQDPSKDRRRRSENAIHDDEDGVAQREQEEQRNEDECAGSCGQRLWHAVSVDEMSKVAT